MKNILKRVFTPIILSVIIGSLCGRIAYKIYSDNLENKFSSQKVYLVQSGAYVSYESMKEDNYDNNYLYYIDNDMYKSVVGITKKYDNVNKIKKMYDDDLEVMEYYISDNEILEKQNMYDKELSDTDDIDKEWDILNNIINLYKKDNNFKLIK